MSHTLRPILSFFLAFSLLAGIAGPMDAEELPVQAADPVKVELLSETSSIQPGHPFWVALHFTIEKEWHAYWKNPGGAGMPPMVEWTLPAGFKVDRLVWPAPKRFLLSSITSFGYEKELTLLAELSGPETYRTATAEIGASLRWVVCSDSNCLPGDAELHMALPVSEQEPVANPAGAAIFKAARAQIPKTRIAAEAQSKEGLIQLNFSLPELSDEIRGVDFFSENKQAIADGQPPLLEKTADRSGRNYTLVLKEEQAASSLKGVLLLKTDKGAHAYELELPIARADSLTEESEVVEAGKPLSNEAAFTVPERKQAQNPFAFEGGLPLSPSLCLYRRIDIESDALRPARHLV